MKTIKIYAIFLLAIVLSSCSSESTNEKAELVELNFERLLENGTLNQINNKTFNEKEFSECSSVVWSKTNDVVLNSLENFLFNTNEFSNNYGFAIYSTKYLDNLTDLNQIIGFSHYKIIDNELIHTPYIIQNNKIVKGTDFLDYQAVDLIFNDIEFMIKSYFKNQISQRIDVTILQSDTKYNTFEKFDGLYLKRLFHDTNSSDMNKTKEISSGPDCKTMCDDIGGGDYCYGDDCRGSYPGGGCRISYMQEKNTPNSGLLIKDDIYSFRDEYMANYKIGRKYINYYYVLSRMFDDNPSLLIEVGQSIPTLITLMNKVVSKDESTTFVNNSIKTELTNLLNEFNKKTNNTYFKAMISDIISDLNLYSNKTLTQIYSEIE